MKIRTVGKSSLINKRFISAATGAYFLPDLACDTQSFFDFAYSRLYPQTAIATESRLRSLAYVSRSAKEKTNYSDMLLI